MTHRNVVAITFGAILALSGVASAKNLLPSSSIPSSTVPPTSSVAPAPRAQPSQAKGAYVPGFDIASRPERRHTVTAATSTIPGAPTY